MAERKLDLPDDLLISKPSDQSWTSKVPPPAQQQASEPQQQPAPSETDRLQQLEHRLSQMELKLQSMWKDVRRTNRYLEHIMTHMQIPLPPSDDIDVDVGTKVEQQASEPQQQPAPSETDRLQQLEHRLSKMELRLSKMELKLQSMWKDVRRTNRYLEHIMTHMQIPLPPSDDIDVDVGTKVEHRLSQMELNQQSMWEDVRRTNRYLEHIMTHMQIPRPPSDDIDVDVGTKVVGDAAEGSRTVELGSDDQS